MRIFEINMTTNGSTGKIMFGIADAVEKAGGVTECAAPIVPMNKNSKIQRPFYRIGNYYGRRLSSLIATVSGYHGCTAKGATKKLIAEIEKFKPDVIQLHNLHSNYINLDMLFSFIKKANVPVVWTLHDCWAMTGKCPHFGMAECEKWRTGCSNCSQLRQYPQMFTDKTKYLWKKKKEWFGGVNDMTLVTPSRWLKDVVKESYLGAYPIKVINNGIDLNIFKPSESDFRKKYGLENKKIILGVSFGWGRRKGLDVFQALAKRLPDDYRIVLVGTDEETDKKLDNIISIHKTQDQYELAGIYTVADVFANPTREEVLGLVNIEALACGTPVVTFGTGGSPETIDETCGRTAEKDDIEGFIREIQDVADNKPFSADACIARARLFSQDERYSEYVELYKSKSKN